MSRPLIRQWRTVAAVSIVGALGSGSSCAGDGVIETPLVRVDLTKSLPRKVRWAAIAAIPLECHKALPLDAGGERVRFRVEWRVLDFRKSRHIVAVEVRPEGDGRVSGVRNLSASAAVGELQFRGSAEEGTSTVRVTVSWRGEKGCRSVARSESLLLRADDKSCVAPKQPKLLRPVK